MLDKTTLYNNIKNEMVNKITMIWKDENGQDVTIKPFESGTATLTYTKDGKPKTVTGFDAMIEIVVDKVLDHLITNTKSSLLQRFEKLEIDFDSLVTSLAGVGVGSATAVPAAIAAFRATSNTSSRASDKIIAATELPTIIYGKT